MHQQSNQLKPIHFPGDVQTGGLRMAIFQFLFGVDADIARPVFRKTSAVCLEAGNFINAFYMPK